MNKYRVADMDEEEIEEVLAKTPAKAAEAYVEGADHEGSTRQLALVRVETSGGWSEYIVHINRTTTYEAGEPAKTQAPEWLENAT